MKKFLTVLLALSVVFTYSFSSVGAVFAGEYTADQASKDLEVERELQVGYMNNAKTQAVNSYDYNDDGFVAIKNINYMKGAVEAAADAAIADATTAMDTEIGNIMENFAANPITKAEALGKVRATTADYITEAGLVRKLEAKTEVLNKTQAPLTKAFVIAELDVDMSKYDDTKDTEVIGADKVTPAEKVQYLIAEAKKAIANADKAATDADKIAGYTSALIAFNNAFNNIPTKEDQGITEDEDIKTVEEAVRALVSYGLSEVYPAVANVSGMTSTETVSLFPDVNGKFKAFWEADKVTANKGKLFGVDVANITKVTKAEASAINNAMYKAINDSADAVKGYANSLDKIVAEKVKAIAALYQVEGIIVQGQDAVYEVLGNFNKDEVKLLMNTKTKLYRVTSSSYVELTEEYYNKMPSVDSGKKWRIAQLISGEVEEVKGMIGDETKFLATLSNAMDVAEKYDDVVAVGEKLKKEYKFGVKTYDDAKVDEAVKAAEALVYADLAGTLKTKAEDYIVAAANAIYENTSGLTNLEAANYEKDKLEKAIEDAKDKFIPAVKNYGDDKTAEADKVYCRDQYASHFLSALGVALYDEIKADALEALDAAQSYAEIEEIMADAAAELNKLVKASEEADVHTAQEAYKTSLTSYENLQWSLADQTKYSRDTFTAALADGKALIGEATTVDAVEDAYEAAKALFDGLKTDEALEDALEALIKSINALPYTYKLTAADKDSVVSVYNEYLAYAQTPGSDVTTVTNKTLLVEKLQKVMNEVAAAINAKAEDMNDELAKVDSDSDADLAAYVALKSEVEAIVAEGKALTDEITAIKEDSGIVLTNQLDPEYTELAGTLGHGNGFWTKEIKVVEIALVNAAKDGATVAEMKAALAAYEALTDRQQYDVDAEVLRIVDVIEDDLVAEVTGLKITASSKAAKGSMTINWKVKGDASAADGFRVYRSKKMNSGYGKTYYFQTKDNTKRSYKNTKELKKGTRYHYKVRAYVVIDGKTYFSDFSNKAYRIAK